ncbi:sugar transferase [Deinococcus murrayi]|uniref:sugar transferase n=1 Tax=Deinococcus murrayi TaxID=68910 RepID=UPI000A4FADF5|nr:sugar transferase [Deinococcus murrayi]
MKPNAPAILFVVTASVSLGFLRGQLTRMRERGWRVGVSSGAGPAGQLESFALSEGASAFPVPMEREINPPADARALRQMYRAVRQFRPDVLNVGTPKAGLLAGLAGAAACVPVRIYTLHGLRLETATGARRQLLTLTERLAMACAHRIVCVSPSLRERVHELRLAPAHKTLVLGAGSANGVKVPEPSRTLPLTSALRGTLNLPEGTPVIGFVGRFTRDKGMSELLEAYQTVSTRRPEVRLLLVGDYEEGDPVPAQVRAAIEEHPGVIRAGFVPDVAPYYPLMTVLALPTYREGFPTVALEAAAMGLPVVTTTATGARDAVQHGKTGWIVPVGDASALAQALDEALAHPQVARERGAAGQAWVREQFSPEQVQTRWADFYGDLLAWHSLSRLQPQKRTFDVLAAGLGLLLLSLPLGVLAGLVRLKLGTPVLFRQVRPGLAGQPFTMYKFRTMTDERGPDGHLLPDAERLTAFGRFLRSTSLDELPELLNVLKGDMSLVGPRPLLMEYLPLYTPRQARRHEVRPGITGWAQVNGRNALSWEEKFELDVWYVENRTLALDLRILCMTVAKVLRRDGISAAGDATMPIFKGSTTEGTL